MALTARYLADKSALARLGQPSVAERLEPLLEGGLVATCSIIVLEILFSARSPAGYDATRRRLDLALELAPITQTALDRAVDVQSELARRSAHRSVALPDLIIAAVAEQHRLAVLHYDADFDRIAEITAQDTEWVVPRGSAD